MPTKLIPTFRISLIEEPSYAAIPNPHHGFVSQLVWRDVWYEAKHAPGWTANGELHDAHEVEVTRG